MVRRCWGCCWGWAGGGAWPRAAEADANTSAAHNQARCHPTTAVRALSPQARRGWNPRLWQQESIIDHHAPGNAPDRDRYRGLAGPHIDHGHVITEAIGHIERALV